MEKPFDYDEVKNWLESRQKKGHFIEPESKFSIKNIQELRDLNEINKTDFKSIFKGNACGLKYILEIECDKCIEIKEKKVSKTDLMDHILKFHYGTCESCKEEASKKIQLENDTSLERTGNTVSFIVDFLDPDLSWREGLKIWERMNSLKNNSRWTHWDEIIEHIKGMNYRDFLQTPYWKAIASDQRKKSGFKCQLCNSEGNLNVHHRTYESLGDELYQGSKNLIVLCRGCHAKHHDIKD